MKVGTLSFVVAAGVHFFSWLGFGAEIKNISPEEFQTIWNENKTNPNLKILDVRTPSEFQEGHLKGAVNINLQANDFNSKISELDRNALYLIYCRSGKRSAMAASKMEKLGFQTLYNMLGGILQWQEEGRPVETGF